MLPDLPPLALNALAHVAGEAPGDLMPDEPPPLDFPDESGFAHNVPTDVPFGRPNAGEMDGDTAENAISRTGERPKSDGGMRFEPGSDTPPVRTVVRTPSGTTPTTASPPVRTGEVRTTPPLATGPDLPRDRAVLLLLVRLRLASMRQLADLAYRGTSLIVARRRLRRLERDGWITFWDLPTRAGAAIRYAVPTRRALAWADTRIAEAVEGGPAATLITRMLPVRTRRLADLKSHVVPPWFAHQNEINTLLVAIARAETDRLLWYSSWDCPFPDRVNGLKAPQPDYVVVRHDAEAVAVTFGEHDRATEDSGVWTEKLAAYAVARELAMPWLGIETFTVDVTVLDPSPRSPILRLRRLNELTRVAGMEHIVRFTLAGWLHAFPGEPVWFTDGASPTSESTGRADHLAQLRA